MVPYFASNVIFGKEQGRSGKQLLFWNHAGEKIVLHTFLFAFLFTVKGFLFLNMVLEETYLSLYYTKMGKGNSATASEVRKQ